MHFVFLFSLSGSLCVFFLYHLSNLTPHTHTHTHALMHLCKFLQLHLSIYLIFHCGCYYYAFCSRSSWSRGYTKLFILDWSSISVEGNFYKYVLVSMYVQARRKSLRDGAAIKMASEASQKICLLNYSWGLGFTPHCIISAGSREDSKLIAEDNTGQKLVAEEDSEFTRSRQLLDVNIWHRTC